MLITFLESSRFHPSLATRYCGDPIDANGQAREEVRVLRGSPQQFEQTAAGLSYKEKYKSAVLAFAPEDDPSEEDLFAVLDEFLDVCFAGLAKERFSVVAYLHRKGTKVDVHVLIAKIDLWTDKQFNAAPPGWQRDFDPLRDAWNWHKGWARPDDPRRARALQPGARSPADAALIRNRLPVAQDPKKELTEMLLAKVKVGLVKNRADVVAALNEVCTVKRDPEDCISVRLKDASKNLRLKGALYMADFDAAKFLAPRAPIGGQGTAKSILDVDPEKEQEARVRLAAAIERRSLYNLKRFRLGPKRMKKGVLTAPSVDLVAALMASGSTTISRSTVPDARSPPPSSLTPTPEPDRNPTQDLTSERNPRKQGTHDRTTHLLHALLEDLVTGMRERFEEFADAIRKAGERLAATGRAMGARAALGRAKGSEAGGPGGSKEGVTADRMRDSNSPRLKGPYDRNA